jgi:Tfp pilus assembly protein PilN
MSSAIDTLVRPHELPQVDLLPPAVRDRRRIAGLRRWLALGLLGVVAICAGGWGLALVQQRQAEEELAAVEARTARLIAQQQEYAEVPQVRTQIDAIEAARLQVSGTEVLWQPYLGAIAATAPDSVSIESLTVSVPAFDGEARTDPSATEAAPGTIVFTARSRDLPDTATWVEQLAAVPGFSDPWFSTASITETDGAVYYTVSALVEINPAAFAHRFEEEK